MTDIQNTWFWTIENKLDGEIQIVLQGDETGASKESLKRLNLFTKQQELLEEGIERINPRLLINKLYKSTAIIIGKIKDPDRIWNDGAIEYLSKDNFIFRVFMCFDENEQKFKFSECNHQFDIYKACDVSHDNPVLMDAEQEEGGIVNIGNIHFGDFSADKSIQDINDGDAEKYLKLFDKMEKDLLSITTNAEKFFEELFKDHTRTICDIIEVVACEFADASLNIQRGLCIEYTISSDDIFQSAYTNYQLRILEYGKIDGVGIHIV